MICHSCGASSANNKVCDYCGASVIVKDLSSILESVDTDRAKTLELNEELSYIFDDETNTEQIISRIVEKANQHIEDLSLKKAEFLSRYALIQSEDDDRAIFLSANIKTAYALKTSGSIQAANIKQKYILDAKTLLAKVKSADFSEKIEQLTLNLDSLDGAKASHFTSIEDDATRQSAETGAGCITIAAWIFAGLFVISFLAI